MKGFGDFQNLPFPEEWLKRQNISKKRRLPRTELI